MIGDNVHRLMMPGRLAALRQMFRFLMSKGVWGPTTLQDSFNSKKYKTLNPGQGTPIPPSPFSDVLAATGFAVLSPTTVPVSGGGAALQTAVTAAGPGTRLLITDSLDYSGIVISGKTDLTIEADSGQSPTVTAAAGPSSSAVRIGAGNSGLAFIGLGLIGNGNQNGLSQPDNGILLGTASVTGMATVDRIIVNNCQFSDLNPALGVPGVQLVGTDGTVHQNVQVIHCTFTDCSTPVFATGAGYGACTIAGFDFVFVQNSKIIRVAVARASSNMRGVVLKNVTSLVQDVLCYDIGSGGSCESFKHNNEAIFGSVVGGSSTWQNCVAYNSRRGFRCTQPAATMQVEHGTFYNDTAGIAAGQTIIQQTSGVLNFIGGVIEGAGDGTAFSATGSESQNDVFNVAATGKVLDVTDLTLDPVLSNPALNDYRATDPAVAVGGPAGTPMGVYYPGGTVIFWAGVP